MVAAGIIRLVETNGKQKYGMNTAYPMLQHVLCEKTNIPAFLVDELCRQMESECSHDHWIGKTSELAFLTTLALKDQKGVTEWLDSQLGISHCLPPFSRISVSASFDFGVEGHVSLQSYDPSRTDSGADVLFEAVLRDGERVCVAIQITCAKDKTQKINNQGKFVVAADLERMAARAVDLFQLKAKRTIIVYAFAFETPTDAQRQEFCRNLPVLANCEPSVLMINTLLPSLKVSESGERHATDRPYSVRFVDALDPIWRELIISKEDMDSHNEFGMRKSVLNKLLPGVEFNPHEAVFFRKHRI